jgi:peptidoglycan hydrolase-like protein with peptidoglycan-binding domain
MHKLAPIVICCLSVALLAVPTAASAARYGSRTLSEGSHGKDVKRLQRYLRKAGHRVSADGEFGGRTVRALRATERELELHVDGSASPREQRAIRRAVSKALTGGALYVAPPPLNKLTGSRRAKITKQGFALAPKSAPRSVRRVIAAGNKIAKTPYKWGGGHGSWKDSGYDCSGSVSYALHAGRLVDSPMVSGNFSDWGREGKGRWITVYSNGGHVYMTVAGLRFDTSARSMSGSRWTRKRRSNDGFAVTHPALL